MRLSFLLTLLVVSTSCAYRWGFRERAIPGGYQHVAIPVFKNLSTEPGIEADYTNALIRQFERSQVGHISSKDVAPVSIEGVIERVEIIGSGGGTVGTVAGPLEPDASLRNDYNMVVYLHVRLRRQSDDKILWEGNFHDQRDYLAPRVLESVVNSADATYNESVRRRTLAELADQMMSEVHDRMTENF